MACVMICTDILINEPSFLYIHAQKDWNIDKLIECNLENLGTFLYVLSKYFYSLFQPIKARRIIADMFSCSVHEHHDNWHFQLWSSNKEQLLRLLMVMVFAIYNKTITPTLCIISYFWLVHPKTWCLEAIQKMMEDAGCTQHKQSPPRNFQYLPE